MSLITWLQTAFSSRGPKGPAVTAAAAQDSAIAGKAVFTAMPFGENAAEVYLALGNLYREQGDTDQAVRLREAVLTLPGVDGLSQARAYFEMGRDYRKAGFLDRALMAYKDARQHDYPPEAVGAELLQLYADSGDFTAAEKEAALLGMPHAEAFYLVRQAEESAAANEDDEAIRLIRRAISVYPASPEAWLALASMALLGGDAAKALQGLAKALYEGTASTRLIVLQGLYSFITGHTAVISGGSLRELVQGLDRILASLKPDVVLCYYAGLFQQMIREGDAAEQWFTKALVLDPDFWAARLAILAVTAGRENLPPLLAGQIAFFTEQGARSRRFVCPPCGLRRDTVFSLCPRCLAWHSVAFRLRIILARPVLPLNSILDACAWGLSFATLRCRPGQFFSRRSCRF